jgi:hypothetical protein
MVGKILTWNGKYVTTAGCTSLIKSFLVSQSIYHLTPLMVPPGNMHNMKKIEHAFLWVATNKVSVTNARLIGTQYVCQKTLVALASSTLLSPCWLSG